MNRLDMQGRVAVVTGGAQGIGYAVAQRMVASGASVVLWDLNAAQLEKARASLADIGLADAGRVDTAVVDITDDARVQAAADGVVRTHGRLDALVNSAGITGGNGTVLELDAQVWRRVIEVNLIGTYLACRAAAGHMVRQRYGRIVNIASVAGKEGNPNASHYSASKAGVLGLTKSMGKELARSGVLVNAVTPGAARTPIFDSMKQEHIDFMLSKIPMGRFLEVDEAAAMIAWLATEDCAFSTGAVFDVSGGRATY